MPGWAYKQIEGVPTHSSPVECESQKQFGSLTYVIDGKNYTLGGHEWTYPPRMTRKFEQADDSTLQIGVDLETEVEAHIG
mmetsp:Transcript_29546/g.45018  ORF Transcript_29546/g.45018 Transcript_29546/m.45018 type:complete len:80 (+) Transcript_29546:1119-1358(+)